MKLIMPRLTFIAYVTSFHFANKNPECLIDKSFKTKDVHYNMESNKEKKKNSPSLSVSIATGVMKNATAENVASSGLNFSHLKTIYNRQGEDGLHTVFTMKNCEGQPRITGVKSTLNSVVLKMAAYFENLGK